MYQQYNFYNNDDFTNFYQFSGGGNMANNPTFGTAAADIGSQIRQTLENLKGKVSETGVELDRCRQEQEAFSVEYYTFKETNHKYEILLQQVCTYTRFTDYELEFHSTGAQSSKNEDWAPVL